MKKIESFSQNSKGREREREKIRNTSGTQIDQRKKMKKYGRRKKVRLFCLIIPKTKKFVSPNSNIQTSLDRNCDDIKTIIIQVVFHKIQHFIFSKSFF